MLERAEVKRGLTLEEPSRAERAGKRVNCCSAPVGRGEKCGRRGRCIVGDLREGRAEDREGGEGGDVRDERVEGRVLDVRGAENGFECWEIGVGGGDRGSRDGCEAGCGEAAERVR